ncbi:MAG: EVE domain-containing protein [Fimbriimonadaceae bacterium]
MKFWLMKSEPDCYSIEDLRKAGTDLWDGCRNYTVRNFMRDQMKPGDLAFFYNSSVAVPGIAGEMEIVSEGYPDPTQFDPDSPNYDPKSPREQPRWMAVDVKYLREYPEVLPLARLRETPGLEGMGVLQRGQRLSVMPVSAEEWAIIQRMVDET